MRRNDQNLFESLRIYSLVLATHYGSSSRDIHTISKIREKWKENKIKTLLSVFATTLLSVLRIGFLSLNETGMGNTTTLYLAYIQLLIAFTDNWALCCQLETPQRSARGFRWHQRVAAAAAG
uniref:7TM_GPCR_Srx domain-containing protein n=1 Tax=Heterorhabditis bacteriophora TaxID=37862 RepID=A0A1I7X9N8_HETBA